MGRRRSTTAQRNINWEFMGIGTSGTSRDRAARKIHASLMFEFSTTFWSPAMWRHKLSNSVPTASEQIRTIFSVMEICEGKFAAGSPEENCSNSILAGDRRKLESELILSVIQSHTEDWKLETRVAKGEDRVTVAAAEALSHNDESDANALGISTEAAATNAASAPHPASRHRTHASSTPEGGAHSLYT